MILSIKCKGILSVCYITISNISIRYNIALEYNKVNIYLNISNKTDSPNRYRMTIERNYDKIKNQYNNKIIDMTIDLSGTF